MWKEIDRFPGYGVSDDGRVRSYWTRKGVPSIRGWRVASKPQRVMKTTRGVRGYEVVTLRSGDGEKLTLKIGNLVMEAFYGPRPAGMEVCHNNSVRADNHLENLRYDTHTGNIADKSEEARFASALVTRKLTDQQVIDIRVKHCVDGITYQRLAEEYGIPLTTIGNACRGCTYAHLPGPRTTTRYVPSAALKQYTARTWV